MEVFWKEELLGTGAGESVGIFYGVMLEVVIINEGWDTIHHRCYQ